MLENDLKIHVFLESVESAVESAVASAPASAVASASRFKDPAHLEFNLELQNAKKTFWGFGDSKRPFGISAF